MVKATFFITEKSKQHTGTTETYLPVMGVLCLESIKLQYARFFIHINIL